MTTPEVQESRKGREEGGEMGREGGEAGRYVQVPNWDPSRKRMQEDDVTTRHGGQNGVPVSTAWDPIFATPFYA